LALVVVKDSSARPADANPCKQMKVVIGRGMVALHELAHACATLIWSCQGVAIIARSKEALDGVMSGG
jgi:hypothetical protein